MQAGRGPVFGSSSQRGLRPRQVPHLLREGSGDPTTRLTVPSSRGRSRTREAQLPSPRNNGGGGRPSSQSEGACGSQSHAGWLYAKGGKGSCSPGQGPSGPAWQPSSLACLEPTAGSGGPKALLRVSLGELPAGGAGRHGGPAQAPGASSTVGSSLLCPHPRPHLSLGTKRSTCLEWGFKAAPFLVRVRASPRSCGQYRPAPCRATLPHPDAVLHPLLSCPKHTCHLVPRHGLEKAPSEQTSLCC